MKKIFTEHVICDTIPFRAEVSPNLGSEIIRNMLALNHKIAFQPEERGRNQRERSDRQMNETLYPSKIPLNGFLICAELAASEWDSRKDKSSFIETLTCYGWDKLHNTVTASFTRCYEEYL